MYKEIQDYLNSVIPKNIGKKKAEALRKELEGHIYDKIMYFKDIGYDTEASTAKALECMGDTDEIKKQINSSFEELYHERTLWALLVFSGYIVLDVLFAFLGIWITSADYKGLTRDSHIAVSMFFVFLCVFLIIFFYEKRLKKCLIALGVSHGLIAASVLFAIYPQCFFYSYGRILGFLADILPNVYFGYDIKEYFDFGCFLCSVVFLCLTAIVCFVLAFRVSKGIKKDYSGKKVRISAAVLAVIAVVHMGIYFAGDKYFSTYPTFSFDWDDDIADKSSVICEMISNVTEYDEAEKILKEYGYILTDDFLADCSYFGKKQFYHEFSKFDIETDPGSKIFFNPNVSRLYVNPDMYKGLVAHPSGLCVSRHLVVINSDTNGKIEKIGCLYGFKFDPDAYYWSSYSFGRYGNDVEEECMDYFENKIKTSSEEDFINKMWTGNMYSYVREYKDSATVNRYRLVFNNEKESYFDDSNNKKKEFSILADVTFTDGKFTEGKVYYEQRDSFTGEEPVHKIINLS